MLVQIWKKNKRVWTFYPNVEHDPLQLFTKFSQVCSEYCSKIIKLSVSFSKPRKHEPKNLKFETLIEFQFNFQCLFDKLLLLLCKMIKKFEMFECRNVCWISTLFVSFFNHICNGCLVSSTCYWSMATVFIIYFDVKSVLLDLDIQDILIGPGHHDHKALTYCFYCICSIWKA